MFKRTKQHRLKVGITAAGGAFALTRGLSFQEMEEVLGEAGVLLLGDPLGMED